MIYFFKNCYEKLTFAHKLLQAVAQKLEKLPGVGMCSRDYLLKHAYDPKIFTQMRKFLDTPLGL